MISFAPMPGSDRGKDRVSRSGVSMKGTARFVWKELLCWSLLLANTSVYVQIALCIQNILIMARKRVLCAGRGLKLST